MPALDTLVKIPETVLFRELEGELVLLSLARGTYFSLDPIGTRFWQLIQACGGDLRQVVTTFREEFDVSEQRCREDLAALTASLCEHGLLERVAPPAA